MQQNKSGKLPHLGFVIESFHLIVTTLIRGNLTLYTWKFIWNLVIRIHKTVTVIKEANFNTGPIIYMTK